MGVIHRDNDSKAYKRHCHTFKKSTFTGWLKSSADFTVTGVIFVATDLLDKGVDFYFVFFR